MIDYLSTLPPELLIKNVVNDLTYNDIKNLCRVSSYFNYNLCQNEYFWKEKYFHDISTVPLANDNYKKEYKKAIKKIENRSLYPINENLFWSTSDNYDQYARYLVEHGANVQVNNNGPLRHAIKNGNLELVKFLVRHGANVNVQAYEDIPINVAAKKGYYKILKFLVKNGAIIYPKTILEAIKYGDIRIVKYLIQYLMSQYDHDLNNYNPGIIDKSLIEATKYGKLNILEYLWQFIDPQYIEDNIALQSVLLSNAVANGNLNILTYILDMLHIDLRNQNIDADLILDAVMNDNLDVLKFLIENGINIHINNDRILDTSLYTARIEGYDDLYDYLRQFK